MALRLNQVVLGGELINTSNYSTHGWLELRGMEQPVMLSLTGNCGPKLAGCHFRFTTRPELQDKLSRPGDGYPREASDIEWLANQQVGPTGEMTLRDVKWFDAPVEEYYQRSKLGEPPPTEIKPSLYLEWQSQNGRVVLELIDPEIEFVERRTLVAPAPGAHLITDPPPESPSDPAAADEQLADQDSLADDDPSDPSPEAGLGVSIIRLDEQGQSTIEEHFFPGTPKPKDDDGASEDLPPADDDLQSLLDAQAANIDRAIAAEGDGEAAQSMREMELMDELIERGTASPMSEMIDTPLRLPKPQDLSEENAEGVLKTLLAELAMSGVSINVCEHYTPKEVYRWLVDDLFPEELGHRELRRTQWVQGFSTSESSCPACEAEFERDWARREQRKQGTDASLPNELPYDDLPYDADEPAEE